MKKSILRTNKSIDWDMFNADSYRRQHFAQPGAEDLWVLERMLSFTADRGLTIDSVARAADIGTGPSLMLPLASSIFARRVDLVEPGAQNVAYLDRVLGDLVGLEQDWGRVQQVISDHPGATSQHGNALERLHHNAVVLPMGADSLPKNTYDIITSVFCAESVTEDKTECAALIQKILGSLKKGGFYVAAYMEGSKGYPDYSTGDGSQPTALKFPAANISYEWLMRQFSGTNIFIERCPFKPTIRAGYDGVLLAIGIK